MKESKACKVSAAAQELARLPDEIDEAVTDARIQLVEECTAEILTLISVELPEIALRRVDDLRPRVMEIVKDLLIDTVMAERSNPDVKRQRARSRGRQGGRVRTDQSRKKLVLELAEKIDAECPGLSLYKLAARVKDGVPGVELSTVTRYLSGFHHRGK
jgi:hypothetical protein